jgi:Beta-lactamase
VARVSGQPYDQYIQEHILDPLNKVHSTAHSTTPANLGAHSSLGYTYIDGTYEVFPDFLVQPAGLPSGGVQASVIDMAHFMIAHLQDGQYSNADATDTHLLKESTLQQMHTTLYTPDPRLQGTAYGFFDLSDNGQRTLGSEGYYPPIHSQLLLLPDQNLGVFVTYNSAGGGELTVQHSGFQRAFFDHYYPASAIVTILPSADFAPRADQIVGRYKRATSPQTTLHKDIGLFGGFTIEIIDPGDGTLLFPLEGHDYRFAEVQPLYFHQVDGPFSIIFREDDQGRITHMVTDLVPEYAYVKLNWYETPGFNTVLAMVCILIFLSVIPVGLTRMIRDRRKSNDRKATSQIARSTYWVILAISVMNLLVVGVLAWGYMGGMPNELLDPPMIIKIILGLGVLSAVLTVGALIYSVVAWKNSYWGIIGRSYYTLVTIAAIAFVWFMNYWNLLSWRF